MEQDGRIGVRAEVRSGSGATLEEAQEKPGEEDPCEHGGKETEDPCEHGGEETGKRSGDVGRP